MGFWILRLVQKKLKDICFVEKINWDINAKNETTELIKNRLAKY